MTAPVANPIRPKRAAFTQPFRKILGELFLPLSGLRAYSGRRFPILTYHSITDAPGSDVETVAPHDFERQMAWLKRRGFDVVRVSDLLLAMAGASSGRRVLAITFDDGYQDNIVTALPILRRYGFRATFYIPTAYIGGLSLWNRIDYIGHRPMLTAREIRSLSEAGQEIGSHAHNHTDLTLVDSAVLDEELNRSKEILSDIIGKAVVAFAPPYGRSNEAVVSRVVRLGYKHLVRSGRFTANPKDASPFDLRRITIARDDSFREFGRKVRGAYQWLTFRDR